MCQEGALQHSARSFPVERDRVHVARMERFPARGVVRGSTLHLKGPERSLRVPERLLGGLGEGGAGEARAPEEQLRVFFRTAH